MRSFYPLSLAAHRIRSFERGYRFLKQTNFIKPKKEISLLGNAPSKEKGWQGFIPSKAKGAFFYPFRRIGYFPASRKG